MLRMVTISICRHRENKRCVSLLRCVAFLELFSRMCCRCAFALTAYISGFAFFTDVICYDVTKFLK